MSQIKVLPIEGKSNLKKFVKFKNKLYKNHPFAIPTLESDELATLDPKKNPAMEFCDMQCFLAYDAEGEIVGRICGIINHRANDIWGKKAGRFGFFDFVEDIEVAKALLAAVESWAKERGMVALQGPLGFTDMDEEGMLVKGYEELGTMATLYNYPYYVDFMEKLGFAKDVDWVEFAITIPERVPERIAKIAGLVEHRTGVRVVKCKTASEMIKQGWATKIFELINTAYAKLYGFTPMTQRQIDHYVKMYIPIVRLELICMIADKDDNLVGFGISLPSLSRALQKSGGKLLPMGWFHMLKALKSKRAEVADLMLIAVEEQYLNKGLTAIIMRDIVAGMVKMGIKYAESNPELESNETVQKQWEVFERREHKLRRAFVKELK